MRAPSMLARQRLSVAWWKVARIIVINDGVGNPINGRGADANG